tara:strand:- start:274 stop:1386 length:1113 start_codon:yes stop_codon:yes gene_type:complete
MIKFVNLKEDINEIKHIIQPKIENMLFNECCYINGEHVKEFETNFANYIGTKYCIGVNSGTDALKLAIKMLGLHENDEVLVQGNTFIGSILGASELNVNIKLIDINKDTYMIDINKIEEQISNKTKAIIIVHLYGICPDMDKIVEISKKYNLYLIEDCAQAHGCYYKDKIVGSIGDVGCFSFYPSKNLGACGDGGAITTNNGELYKKINMWKNWGAEKKYYHKYKGGNSRLDTIQAIILNEKLKLLDINNEKRRKNVNYYMELLKNNNKVILPQFDSFCVPVWHLFVIRLENETIRNKLLDHLKNNNVEVGIHYPIPIHNLEAYSELNDQQYNLGICNDYSKIILSLPMYPNLTKKNIEYICNLINNYFK